jgi:hypothetical protein
MALLFYALLLAWAGWHQVGMWWPSNRSDRRQTTARRPFLDDGQGSAVGGQAVWLALLLGLGCAAFFWLPVILERNAVTLNTLIGQGDNYDFRTHFLSVGELLAFSLRPDWSAAQSTFHHNLGVAQWLLGGLGLLALFSGKARHRFHLAFFALAFLVLLMMMLPLSQPVWEAIPFLPFFQFPWRLLGAVAAMLAVLAGAGADMLLSVVVAPRLGKTSASWAMAALVAFPILLGLSVSQPAPWPDFGEVNTLRMSLIENSGRWLGTTSTADYVPATVEMLPQRKSEVVGNFALGLPPDRVNREVLPDGASVETEVIRPLLTRYHVSTPKQFRLRLYQFDFPGWQVRVDGQPATTELARPEGFIVVLIPAGEHVVELKFGTTPARTLAWVVSAASLLVTLALVRSNHFSGPGGRLSAAGDLEPSAQAEDMWRCDWPVLAVVLALTLAHVVLEPLGLFHDDSSAYTAEPAGVDTYANLGDQIALIGYDRPATTLKPGDELPLTFYWQALQPLTIDYQVFAHVLGPDGRLVAQSDRLNPGDFPTHRWPTAEYVIDPHRLQLPADLPPGSYTVSVGLWVQSEGWRLPLFDANGRQVGDNVALFTLRVE